MLGQEERFTGKTCLDPGSRKSAMNTDRSWSRRALTEYSFMELLLVKCLVEAKIARPSGLIPGREGLVRHT